jgi:hypothetical protein
MLPRTDTLVLAALVLSAAVATAAAVPRIFSEGGLKCGEGCRPTDGPSDECPYSCPCAWRQHGGGYSCGAPAPPSPPSPSSGNVTIVENICGNAQCGSGCKQQLVTPGACLVQGE